MFLNHLYGGMDEPELKIIDVFTCKLRKKLAKRRVMTVISKRSGGGGMC
jgi:two-component system cell cycle response regulator CtrA